VRNIIILVVTILFFSCDQSDSKKDEAIKKNQPMDSTKKPADTLISGKNDSALLMQTSIEILAAIKAKNYEKLSSFIHPQYGIRFSPYAYVDTTNQKFSADELIKLAKQNKKIDWGSGYAEPEKLTVDKYFSKWVYDVDFLNAILKSFNSFHSQGTDLNNIEEAYPGCKVIEFFFPGFDKKYGGTDYRALRLVFKMKDNIPYLVGIVHDSWTP
jgi:hypothetical protein